MVATIVVACASPTTPSTGPILGPPAPSTVETPPPTGDLDPALGWQRVDLTGVASPNILSDVLVVKDQFLTVGVGGNDARTPIALTSVDGLTWLSEPITSAFAYPSTLAAVGDGIVALGAGETNRCAHPFALDSWSRSAAGRWMEAPWTDDFCAGLNEATLLRWQGLAWLVAAGSGDQPFDWSSVDGRHWIVRGDAGAILPRGAAVDGAALVVIGTDEAGRLAGRRTLDGRAFSAMPLPLIPDAQVVDVIARDARLMLFLDASGRLVLATHDEGSEWVVTPTTGIPGNTSVGVRDIGDRLIATGTDADGLPVGWSSPDGITWTTIQLPDDVGPGTTLSGMAVLDGTAVLVGQTETPDGQATVGAIWVGSAALLGG